MSESAGPPPVGESAPRNRTAAIAWIAIAIVCGLLVAGTFAWQRMRRNADNLAACSENFKKIVLALHAYHDALGCFPPAYFADKSGRPLHSWRVLVLPFLGQRTLYDKYRFDEPWDGPHNRELMPQMPAAFRCPADVGDEPETSYVVVTGEGTVFPGRSCCRIASIQDGPANTILFVEIANSGITWMEPRDLTFEQALVGINPETTPGLSGRHGRFATVATADGSIWMLPENLSRETLEKLLLRNDGQVIPDFGRPQASAVEPTPAATPPPEGVIYK